MASPIYAPELHPADPRNAPGAGSTTSSPQGRQHCAPSGAPPPDVDGSIEQRDPRQESTTRDALTGLLNRHGLERLLDELLGDGPRERVAVLYCDVDHFTRINTSLDHDAGDELLVALAHHLTAGLPSGCTPARLSGDDFVIVCPDVTVLGGLESFTVRLNDFLHTSLPVRGQQVRVSTSVGAAAVTSSGVTGRDLVRFADAALSRAKDTGPHSVAHADPELVTTVNAQLRLEGQLRRALARDELELHYQPIVTTSGSVLAAEALLRWSHPDDGMLSPRTILSVAEQGGMLRELDLWVLRTALTEAAHWPTGPRGRPVDIALNLGGRLPREADFADTVRRALTDSGLSPDRLILELTETALMDRALPAGGAFDALAEAGVRFALDDFGTGYSSLARLKDLPTHIIKLDQRFTAGLPEDAEDLAIVRAVADLARGTGHRCLAEGVETSTQLHLLRGLGVEACQGFLFSPAVPAHEFRDMLHHGPRGVHRAAGKGSTS